MPVRWIKEHLSPEYCTTDVLIYDDMHSQSGFSLPVIYQPFDGTKVAHWRDRGSIYDYLYATQGEGRRLLDFGPGDGWPSLLVAPFADEVVGLDASPRRVEVCRANARRLDISNASFSSYQAGRALPFPDESFDGVMAAHSVEQTPDPRQILSELYRVLRPGGRLRMHYEGLAQYRGGREQDIWISALDSETCRIILYDRNIAAECVVQYGITLSISEAQLLHRMKTDSPEFSDITRSLLGQLKPEVMEARMSRTIHPSAATWIRWLRELGFRQVRTTHGGGEAASAVYGWFTQGERPRDMRQVDAAIRPAVRLAADLGCPMDMDPPITAVK